MLQNLKTFIEFDACEGRALLISFVLAYITGKENDLVGILEILHRLTDGRFHNLQLLHCVRTVNFMVHCISTKHGPKRGSNCIVINTSSCLSFASFRDLFLFKMSLATSGERSKSLLSSTVLSSSGFFNICVICNTNCNLNSEGSLRVKRKSYCN